jgi:N-acetylneuraminate lyase
MIYYNPAAGFPMTAAFAARVFEVDNVTAIKWTSPNFFQLATLKDLTHGEMNVINGPDEMMLSGLSAGADGAIGTTYNFQLDSALGVYRNFIKGDIAAAWVQQCRINRVVDALKKYVTIPFTKAILEKQGYAVGNCVFPMKRYAEEEKEAMYAAYLEARK